MAPTIFETNLISKPRNPCTAAGSTDEVDQCDPILRELFWSHWMGCRENLKLLFVGFETKLRDGVTSSGENIAMVAKY